MKLRLPLTLGMVGVTFCLCAPLLEAQQGCPAPPFSPTTKVVNIFNERQEADLGDAQAEHVQRNFRVIDDQVTEYLQGIGDRLTAQLPKNDMHFRFLLVDIPVANAFTLAGGRVYVTRKLVAQTRSEDELAGVLGHEIGHNLMHELSANFTAFFEKVLGVTQVGDRKDIFDKYNQLLDNAQRKPGAFKEKDREEREGQMGADRAGIYLVAQAGYAPQAAPEFWDRTQEVKGKTGSGLSDFFGVTRPEQRRLREMLKMANSLPESCVRARTAPKAEEYQKWQAAVIAYSGLGRKESLHAILKKQVLDPPMQDDINHLKFSSDGRYVLAQNDATIYVIGREPFETLFRIDAPDAFPAQFSPDGKSVVFYRPDLRVERWSIEEEVRTDVYELTLSTPSLQSALSPDGKFLACLNTDFHLNVYTAADGQMAYQKKNFFVPNILQIVFLMLMSRFSEDEVTFNWMQMGFSPDAHYFLGTQGDNVLALDLNTKSPINLPGSVKKLLGSSFTFYDGERLLGVRAGDKVGTAVMIKFPSGEPIAEVAVGSAAVSAPARGKNVLLRPIAKYPLGVLSLETKKIYLANRNGAFDMFDDLWVSERRTGELGLYRDDPKAPIGVLNLPRSSLGPLRAAAVSQNMSYLAISQKSRGAVWNLEKGERVFQTRGFRGADAGEDGIVTADFPKFEDTERQIAQLNTNSRQITDGPKLEEQNARQFGSFLLLTKPNKKNGDYGKNMTLEVQDARTRKPLWTRVFPKERPGTYIGEGSATMVLWWHLDEGHAKDTINGDPSLKARLAAMKEKANDYLLEIVEARTGKVMGRMLVETGKGSFHIERALAVGDHLIIADSNNRVVVFSLASGEQKGRVFGKGAAVSPAGNLLCVENEVGKVAIYDLAQMDQARDKFVFSFPITMARFSSDGKRLFVLTNDQTTYLLDMTATAAKIN